jgi:hypothetical protein
MVQLLGLTGLDERVCNRALGQIGEVGALVA